MEGSENLQWFPGKPQLPGFFRNQVRIGHGLEPCQAYLKQPGFSHWQESFCRCKHSRGAGEDAENHERLRISRFWHPECFARSIYRDTGTTFALAWLFTKNHRHSERATTLQLSPAIPGDPSRKAHDERRKEFSRTAEAASSAKPCLVAFFRSLVEAQQRWARYGTVGSRAPITNLEQRIAAASSKAYLGKTDF